MVWRRRDGFSSSGLAYWSGDKISINAGQDRIDQKVVLLHELAHWIVGPVERHNGRFWDVAWELFRWAKLPIGYTKRREGDYRKGALAAYHRTRR